MHWSTIIHIVTPVILIQSSSPFFCFICTLTNWGYYFPKYCHQNSWSFINSKHLLGIITLLTHIFVCSLFVNSQELLLLFSSVCTFIILGCKLMAICIMFIFLVYICYSTMVLLIGNITYPFTISLRNHSYI